MTKLLHRAKVYQMPAGHTPEFHPNCFDGKVRNISREESEWHSSGGFTVETMEMPNPYDRLAPENLRKLQEILMLEPDDQPSALEALLRDVPDSEKEKLVIVVPHAK